MLTIRLTRKGKKNQPFFRVVLVDKRRSSTGGRAVEDLGYVDPLKKRKSFDKERILHWISKGAQTSATVHNLLISEKIIDDKKIKIFNVSKKKQAELDKAKADADIGTPKPEATATAEAPKPAVSAEGSGEPKEEPKPAQ
jgi:small subunit ribosomal protein S16